MFESIFRRLAYGFQMGFAAMRVVRSEPKLMAIAALPFLSLVALIVVIVMGGPAAAVWMAIVSAPKEWHTALMLAAMFSGYLLIWFVMTFFNTVLVLAALSKLDTDRVSLAECFSIAFARLPQIMAWSAFAATIGLVLSFLSAMLKEKLGLLGHIIGVTFEATWAVATYFALPVLVVEGVGPLDATQRSYQLMKRTWGESLGGNVGTGLLGFVLMLPVFLGFSSLLTLLRQSPSLVDLLPVAIMMVSLYVGLVMLFMSAVAGILRSALYIFAVSGEAPRGFDPTIMGGAFVRRG